MKQKSEMTYRRDILMLDHLRGEQAAPMFQSIKKTRRPYFQWKNNWAKKWEDLGENGNPKIIVNQKYSTLFLPMKSIKR